MQQGGPLQRRQHDGRHDDLLDPNTIYYTLSTIAQTLAGALAVLVAIVLFNFDKVNNMIGNRVALDPDRKSPPSSP